MQCPEEGQRYVKHNCVSSFFIFKHSLFPLALEAQLESEHEERTLLVREKHELERQLLSMAQHAAHAADDDTIQKLKRDLKRTKALLKDAYSQLERARSETPSKVLLRQLKNQVCCQTVSLVCNYEIHDVIICSWRIRNLLVRPPSRDVNTPSKNCSKPSNNWMRH